MRFCRFFLYLLLSAPLAAPALAAEKTMTVLELFTTQSCADCPPADMILEKIADEDEQHVIALGCHITYFDSGPWKDTLSISDCDERQGDYFSSVPLEAIYTPQMVINGRFDAKGNKESLVRAAIAMSQSVNMVQELEIGLNPDSLQIALPAIKLEQPTTLWVISYDFSNTTIITAGQNAGQTIRYVNPVRHIRKIIDWDGSATTMTFPLTEIKAQGYAVIAQYEDSGDILAAGKAEKRSAYIETPSISP